MGRASHQRAFRPARDLGGRVRSRRKELGLTLEELAHRSRIHPTYLSGLEHGVRNPSLRVIAAVARGLEVSLSELFSDAIKGSR
ncbi:MAG: helix-turn-helix transcriptional regulator [Alphaproteobacteria bacterium]|nr:helix-turn-helix transcriptional regulator [Alphaproteobacteria bacterium]